MQDRQIMNAAILNASPSFLVQTASARFIVTSGAIHYNRTYFTCR